MGDRGNIVLQDNEDRQIFIYSHWTGSRMVEDLRKTLRRARDRWDDPQYLGRIVFDGILGKASRDGLTGYGLSTAVGDGEIEATVFVDQQKVVCPQGAFSFEEFVAHDLDKAG